MRIQENNTVAVDEAFDVEKQGTLLFNEKEMPLTPDEWLELESLLDKSDFEHIIGGDANESHSVWVSRYFNDVDEPKALSSIAKEVEQIVMSPKMRRFYAKFTGTEKLCLRRCQANKMYSGDFIGMHKDQDSSPEYFATVVFHLDCDYEGGAFETCDQRQYRPERHMALVNNCSISHQVARVESGMRLTLACFLSKSFGASSNLSRYEFRVDKRTDSGDIRS